MAAFAAQHDEVHGWRRGMRWVKRIALGLLALIVLAVVAVIVYVHTDYGRDKMRSIGNEQLANIFTGGGSIGKVEGTPFGDLILKDVVINGPDAKPAITVKTLHVSVSIFDLVHRDVKLKEILAEDLDVAIKRDADGTFPISRLLKPAKKEPAKDKIKNPETSPWNIDLNDVTVLRGHVMIDTGQADLGVVNLDDIVIESNAQLHGSGTRTAGLRLGATWRERKVPVSILGAIRDDAEQTIAPHFAASIGGVAVSAANLALVKALPGKLPGFSGTLVIGAPKAAVAALLPRIDLPGDVALSVTAKGAASSVIPIEIAGTVGEARLKANVGADLEKKQVIGTLETNELDVAKLTHGKVLATGAIAATFDVMQGAPGELPTAKAKLTAHGTYQQIPRAELVAELESHGQEASTTIVVSGPAKAKLEAAITRAGQGIHLDRARLVAAVADPMRVSGGKAPVHGALDLNLSASGQLSPSPDLAVKGAINGTKLRMKDLSASSLALAIDGAHLPSQPSGNATLVMTDVVRGEMQLGKLELGAKSRSDGRIAVNLTSHPKQNPWLIELAALVTPPGHGDTLTVELGHHRVRAGNGAEWTGDKGRFVMDPSQLALIGFESKSRDGSVALDLAMRRASGDLTASADIHNFALAAIGQRYRGTLDAKVAVARKANRFTGTASLTGKDLSPDPTKPGVNLQATVDAKPGAIQIDGTAQGAELGKATVAVRLAAPANVTDAAAWKRAGRAAIQEATITAQDVDLAQVALLTGKTVDRTVMPPPYLPILGHVYGFTRPGAATPVTVDIKPIGGRLNGTFTLTPTTAKGDFKVADLQAPQVRGLGRVDAELVIDQTSATQIVPVLKITTGSFGTVTARAELALPDNPMDAAAWQKLGLRALHGATVRTGTVKIDPEMLERLGIHGTMNGTATFSVDIGEAIDSIKIVADINDLHGSPIATPIGVHLEANLAGRTATAQFLIKTAKSPIMQVQLTGKLPMTIDELRANPLAIKTAAVNATLELKETSAPGLLAVFGRDQITDGNITGKIDVTGTLAAPVVKAHVIAANLVSRPGSRGKRVPTVKQITLDGNYDGHAGTVTLAGEQDSGGKLNLVATLTPKLLQDSTAKLTATNFNLAPVFAFAPDPGSAASGTLDANLAIRGFDVRTAQIAGEVHLKEARMPIAPSVGTLRKANIDIVITNKDIVIAAAGKLGKGDLKVDGTIALNGADLSGGQFKAVLHHVSPIGALEPEIDSVISGKMGRQGAKWIADITIDKTFVKIDKTSGEALKPVGTPSDLRIGNATKTRSISANDQDKTKASEKTTVGNGKDPKAPPPPEIPGLVAHIQINPIKVESEQFRTTVHGKLDITADAKTMGVVGTVEATSGDLDLFGRRYRIERAAVIFDGTVDPTLAVRITHDFPDVQTITEVRGRLSKPDLELSSDSGLYSKEQLLGFLLGGEPGGDPSSGSARDKAASLGSSIVANQIGGYIKKALPFDLDVLKYEAASATSSAAITVGSWLTHTLFFSFTQHLSPRPDENSSEGTLEYWFTRQLEIETTAGDRNYDGVDLLWRKRF